jgi:uncharacterized protein (TIGR03067 family)
MKTLRTTLLIAGALLATPLAWAGGNDATNKDMARLQGEWSMVSGIADGDAVPDDILRNSRWLCEGNEVTETVAGQLVMKVKTTIDPSKKPKAIDFQVTGGPTKGKTHPGIYELDGDTFKCCFGESGAERPTDFTSKPGNKRTFSRMEAGQMSVRTIIEGVV